MLSARPHSRPKLVSWGSGSKPGGGGLQTSGPGASQVSHCGTTFLQNSAQSSPWGFQQRWALEHTGTEMTFTPPRARGRRPYLTCFRHKKTTSSIPPSQWTKCQGLPPTEPPLSPVSGGLGGRSVGQGCVCVCVCVFGKQGRGEENTSTLPSPSPFRPVAQINLLLTLECQSWLRRRASPHPQACSSP